MLAVALGWAIFGLSSSSIPWASVSSGFIVGLKLASMGLGLVLLFVWVIPPIVILAYSNDLVPRGKWGHIVQVATRVGIAGASFGLAFMLYMVYPAEEHLVVQIVTGVWIGLLSLCCVGAGASAVWALLNSNNPVSMSYIPEQTEPV